MRLRSKPHRGGPGPGPVRLRVAASLPTPHGGTPANARRARPESRHPNPRDQEPARRGAATALAPAVGRRAESWRGNRFRLDQVRGLSKASVGQACNAIASCGKKGFRVIEKLRGRRDRVIESTKTEPEARRALDD